MKIGLFTDTFYPEINGVATSCLNLERELTRRGHEVHVYAPKCKGWQEMQAPNLHYTASVPLPLLTDRNLALPDYASLKDALKTNFDIIHTNTEFNLGSFGRFVAKTVGCPTVHTYHTVWEEYTNYITRGLPVGDEFVKKYIRFLSRNWCDKFNRVIVPTAKTRSLLWQYGVDSPIDVIPSGLDIARFAPEKHSAEEIASVRAECGVKENERVLLYIGRIAKEKNIEQVMRVFPALHELHPEVRFVIVGEGPQRKLMSEMAQELGVSEHVSVIGPRPWEQIDKYYAIGDVFASASHSETQGLTYIEAMAAGVCICAAKDPCLYGVIEDGVSGILSGDSDEEFLACLQLAFSPVGKEIAQNGYRVAQPFSIAAFGEKVEHCYLEAIRGGGEPSSSKVRVWKG